MTKGLEFKWNRYYLKHIIGKDFYRNKSKTLFTIRDVLENYWESFLTDMSHLKIRPIVYHEVEKVLKCRTGELGYTMYECPDCNNFFIVNHTCKSRFLSSCGNQYAKT
jgi:hypothetical protein